MTHNYILQALTLPEDMNVLLCVIVFLLEVELCTFLLNIHTLLKCFLKLPLVLNQIVTEIS
jgi:hypothetical protein